MPAVWWDTDQSRHHTATLNVQGQRQWKSVGISSPLTQASSKAQWEPELCSAHFFANMHEWLGCFLTLCNQSLVVKLIQFRLVFITVSSKWMLSTTCKNSGSLCLVCLFQFMPWITSRRNSAKPFYKQTQLLQGIYTKNWIWYFAWMVTNCKCALSSGIKQCHSWRCCAMCGWELPLWAPLTTTSPLNPAALRGTGKVLLEL